MRRLLVLLLAIVIACSPSPSENTPPPPAAVASVFVTPGTQSIAVGGTASLTAAVKASDGSVLTGRTVSWTTSASGTATVSGSGVVTGVSAGGPVTITATSGGKSGSAQVSVTAVPVATIEVTATKTTLSPGEKVQLAAVTKAAGGAVLTGRAVTWKTSSDAIGTVNSSGLVTAVGAGTLTVTATSEGAGGSVVLTVSSSVKSLALGPENSCALKSDGTVLCWGRGDEGGVGDQANVDRSIPASVSGNLRFQSLAGSQGRTCGIATDGRLYCWGSNNNHGLGLGPLGSVPPFVSVPTKTADTVTTFTSVSSSQQGSLCALTNGGVRWCWGDNDNIELGNGLSVDVTVPTRVAPPLFTTVAMGNYHGCALAAGGVPWCWGYNGHGAIGDSSFVDSSVPKRVVGGHFFTTIVSLQDATCALKADGSAWCWGSNDFGMSGDGTVGGNRYSPRIVPNAPAFVQLDGHGQYVCGRTGAGSAYCWGRNTQGQLGDGSTTNRSVPTPVAGSHLFVRIATGTVHSCGIAADAVYCWGANTKGILGDGTLTPRLVPTKVLGGF